MYRRGDQLERERLRVGGRSTGIDREHITWFSFEGEFVVDYPTYLYGRPAQEGGVHETIQCFVEGTKSWR